MSPPRYVLDDLREPRLTDDQLALLAEAEAAPVELTVEAACAAGRFGGLFPALSLMPMALACAGKLGKFGA